MLIEEKCELDLEQCRNFLKINSKKLRECKKMMQEIIDNMTITCRNWPESIEFDRCKNKIKQGGSKTKSLKKKIARLKMDIILAYKKLCPQEIKKFLFLMDQEEQLKAQKEILGKKQKHLALKDKIFNSGITLED